MKTEINTKKKDYVIVIIIYFLTIATTFVTIT
jgi:hypothetical protein